MSYNCSAVAVLEVDGVDIKDVFCKLRTKSEDEFLNYYEIINRYFDLMHEIPSASIPIYFNEESALFFKSFMLKPDGSRNLDTYISFTNTIHNVYGTYEGEFDISEHLLSDKSQIYYPNIIIDILLFTYYFSLGIYNRIKLGIGDVGYFWLELELVDGKINSINEIRSLENEQAYGFICTKDEIISLLEFLSKVHKWDVFPPEL